MYDYPAESQCGSENLIYRLFRKFIEGATQEEALKEILKEDSQNDTDLPNNEVDE